MKLITMKCPNCHANVDVEDNKQEFFCSYCRMTTKIDEEIVKVEVIDKDLDKELKVAKTYLEDFKDYEKAFQAYQEISLKYPYEPEAWLGMILSKSENLKLPNLYLVSKSVIYSELYEIKKYLERYTILEKDGSKKEENIIKINDYLDIYNKERKKLEEDSVRNLFIGICIIIGLFLMLAFMNL